MQSLHNLEESLRETACLGDVDKVGVLVRAGVDVNSQNAMNGWTALHWGARRNHESVVSYLLESGADANIRSFQNELAVDVTQSEEMRRLLLGEDSRNPKDVAGNSHIGNELPKENTPSGKFVPNYLQNPQFPYSESVTEFATRLGIQRSGLQQQNGNPMVTSDQRINYSINTSQFTGNTQAAGLEKPACASAFIDESVLVIKCRLADSEETDFIEVELDQKCLNFEALVETCMTELNVDEAKLKKVRKLPNTIVRNDRDVKRLVQFQEVEIVLN